MKKTVHWIQKQKQSQNSSTLFPQNFPIPFPFLLKLVCINIVFGRFRQICHSGMYSLFDGFYKLLTRVTHLRMEPQTHKSKRLPKIK